MERLLRLNGVSVPPFYGGILGAERCSAQLGRCDLRKGIEVDDTAGTVTIHLVCAGPRPARQAGASVRVRASRRRTGARSARDGSRPFRGRRHVQDSGHGPYVAASFDPSASFGSRAIPASSPSLPMPSRTATPTTLSSGSWVTATIPSEEAQSARWKPGSPTGRADSHRRRSSGSLFGTLLNSTRRPWVESSISCSTRVSGRSPTSALAVRSRMQSTAIALRCSREGSWWHGRPARSCRRPCRDTAPTAPTRSTPPPGSGAPRPRARAAPGGALAHPRRARGDRDSSGEPRRPASRCVCRACPQTGGLPSIGARRGGRVRRDVRPRQHRGRHQARLAPGLRRALQLHRASLHLHSQSGGGCQRLPVLRPAPRCTHFPRSSDEERGCHAARPGRGSTACSWTRLPPFPSTRCVKPISFRSG